MALIRWPLLSCAGKLSADYNFHGVRCKPLSAGIGVGRRLIERRFTCWFCCLALLRHHRFRSYCLVNRRGVGCFQNPFIDAYTDAVGQFSPGSRTVFQGFYNPGAIPESSPRSSNAAFKPESCPIVRSSKRNTGASSSGGIPIASKRLP